MLRHRAPIVSLACAAIASFVCLVGQSQSTLRRVTNTTDEGLSVNPSVSGDGRIVAFESTEDVVGAGGADTFRAIRADISREPATFFQVGRTRAVSPAISQDGSWIAFSSKDDPLGTNSDGNSEIFLFNGSTLLQVTNTWPGDAANRFVNGNFQPSISDDGRYVAFSSNRNITSQNSDGNLEIFIYDSVAATFTQLTNSNGIVGCTDAKISGNGAKVAYILDEGSILSTKRDLMIQDRTSSSSAVLASQVQSLLITYGRAISDDGTRVVYSGETAANSSQVFFYDGRGGNVNRQVTSLGTRTTEVPLHATISGDGKRIAFVTRRTVTGFSNADASVELYTYDIPTTSFARVTSAPAEADCFDGSNLACEVVSSLNDDGSTIVFNFPRALSGTVAAGLENKSEIYATDTAARPPFGTLTSILNQASLGHEPAPVKAVAPDSIAAAFGSALANTTQQSQKQADGTFPTNVAGTTVTVNGRAAQIFFVSPDRVHFLMPPQTEIGATEVVITNADGFQSKGSVLTLRTAPGVFTKTGDGVGEGMIVNANTLADGPFDPTGGNLRLLIFTTGVRNSLQTTVNIGGRIVTPESITANANMPGLDEVTVRAPSDLRGAGTVNLTITADGRASNPVTVTFTGDPSRNVVINEVLADPPDGIAGDANHDGVRDGTQDEFVELVNGTSNESISLTGWTIRTRATGSTTENTRFTFAGGTSLPAGEAIVVFGGGNFDPTDSVFGCAQVVKAITSSGLSLTNSGLTILVRDAAGNLITQLSYGGSTGIEGDNNQSLTRSPDVTGGLVQHTAAIGANGRAYSPGLRTNDTPFGNCPGILSSVTLSPPSASITVGQTQQSTAQAFDQYGRVMKNVTITFSSDNTSVATVESVSMDASTGVATANVKGKNPGTAHITASATDGSKTVNSSQASLAVTGP
ncbi:MAG TPA: lamin tail domain-containing protein, partial [Pyrinomonadaceae bacterium]|nr:lamin tail domain-containing protein [Pyrinomonadaceae bacterium]